MKRPLAILLTLVIVCGIPVGLALFTEHIASEDTSGVVGVLAGCAFGTFARDIYRALLNKRGIGSIGNHD
jgi:hypothetical protein